MKEALQQHYGFILEPELLREIEIYGRLVKIEQNQIVIDIDERLSAMPLLLNGAVKILREDEHGDELVLYYIEKGDTCAMTINCCVGTHKSKIRAIAETDTELVMVPIDKIDHWLAVYKSWRDFILKSYHARMMELLETVDTLAFMNLDERLLKYLRDKTKLVNDAMLHITHQEIASDLHTSRVVISRLLKRLELEGKIKMYRTNIKVLDV